MPAKRHSGAPVEEAQTVDGEIAYVAVTLAPADVIGNRTRVGPVEAVSDQGSRPLHRWRGVLRFVDLH